MEKTKSSLGIYRCTLISSVATKVDLVEQGQRSVKFQL